MYLAKLLLNNFGRKINAFATKRRHQMQNYKKNVPVVQISANRWKITCHLPLFIFNCFFLLFLFKDIYSFYMFLSFFLSLFIFLIGCRERALKKLEDIKIMKCDSCSLYISFFPAIFYQKLVEVVGLTKRHVTYSLMQLTVCFILFLVCECECACRRGCVSFIKLRTTKALLMVL